MSYGTTWWMGQTYLREGAVCMNCGQPIATDCYQHLRINRRHLLADNIDTVFTVLDIADRFVKGIYTGTPTEHHPRVVIVERSDSLICYPCWTTHIDGLRKIIEECNQ